MANYGSKVRKAQRAHKKSQQKTSNEARLQQMYINTFSTFDNYAKGIGRPETTGRVNPGTPRGGWTMEDKRVKEWEKEKYQSFDAFTFFRPEDIIKSQGGSTSLVSPVNFKLDKFITHKATTRKQSTDTYRSIADSYKEKAISAEFGQLASAQKSAAQASKPLDTSYIKSARNRGGGTIVRDKITGKITSVEAKKSKGRNDAGFFISDGGLTGLSDVNQTNYNLSNNYSNPAYTAAKAHGELRAEATTQDEKQKIDSLWQLGIKTAYAEKFNIDINKSYGTDNTKTVAQRKADEAANAQMTFEGLYGSYANVTSPTEERVLPNSYYTLRGLDIPTSTTKAADKAEEKRIKAEQDKNDFNANNFMNNVYTSQQQGTNASAFQNNLVSFDAEGKIDSAPTSGIMNMDMFQNVSPEKQKEISSYLIDVMVDERIDQDKAKIDSSLSEINKELVKSTYEIEIEKVLQQNRDKYGAQTSQDIIAYGDDKNKQKGSDIMSDYRMQGLPTLEENGVAYDPVAFTMTNQVIGNEKLDFEGTVNQYFINSNSPTPPKSYVNIGGTLYNTRSEYNKANPDDKLTRDQWGAMDSKLSKSEQKKYNKAVEAKKAAESYKSLITEYADIYGEEYVSPSSHPNAIKELDVFTDKSSTGDFGNDYRSQTESSMNLISGMTDKREELEANKRNLLKDKKTIEDALSSVGRNDYIKELYDSGAYNDSYTSGSLLTITKDPGRDRMINQIELYASEQKQTKGDIRRVDNLQAEIDKLKKDKNKKNSSEYSTLVLSQQDKLKDEKKELEKQLKNINNFEVAPPLPSSSKTFIPTDTSNLGLTRQQVNEKNEQDKKDRKAEIKNVQTEEKERLKSQIDIKNEAIKELKTQTNWQVRKDDLYEKITSVFPTMPTAFADTGIDNATLSSMNKKLNQINRTKKNQNVLLKDAKNKLALRLAKASTTEENVSRANIINQTQQTKDEFEKLSGLDVSELEEDGYTSKQITDLAFAKMDQSGMESSGVLNAMGERKRAEGGVDKVEGGWYDVWLNKGGSDLMRSSDDIDLVLGGKKPDQGVKKDLLGKKAILEKYNAWDQASGRIGGAITAWKTELGNFYGRAHVAPNVADSTVSKTWFGTHTVEGESWGAVAQREIPRRGLHIGARKNINQVISKSEQYSNTLLEAIDVKKQELSVLRKTHSEKEAAHKSLKPQIDKKIEMGIKDGNISRDDAFEAKLRKSSQELYDLNFSIAEHQVAQTYYEKSLGKTNKDIEKFKQRKKEIEFEIIQGTSSSGMINRIRRSGSWGRNQANRFRRNTGSRKKTTRGGRQSLGGLVR